ncbi:amidohydrolase family protein [Thalassobaculum sp.]|uniref:amidohydrolase family protein n=1 Tax=Thalassobaculum sp. TaxID=2022740 RepID=UPI003B5BF8C1
MTDLKIVDSHHHLWDLGANYYPWLSDRPEPHFFLGDYSALKRNYLPEDYKRDAVGFDIVKTVHCEAEWDRDNQVAETEWLTALFERAGMPNAIVGHVWLEDPEVEAKLEGHCRSPLMRGIRSKPVTSATIDAPRPDGPRSLADPAWRRGYAALGRFGLSYDLRVPFWHLGEAAELIEQHPEIPVVVNHTGFPWDRSPEGLAAWRAEMKRIAKIPWVHLKLSELGLKQAPWSVESNRGVVLEALEIFGPERCMWASNFPPASLRIGFRDQLEGFLDILSGLTRPDLEAVFHDTATRFYRL